MINIKQFVEQSEREFDKKEAQMKEQSYQALVKLCTYNTEQVSSIFAIITGVMDYNKSFTSQKLRELIGEVKAMIAKEVEAVSPPYEETDPEFQKRLEKAEDFGRMILHLLDEIK